MSFFFGMAAGSALREIQLIVVLFAILSLTLVCMLPVALSMMGTHLSAASVAFMGWFGPRGLALIVLGLVAEEQEVDIAGASLVTLGVLATVLLKSLPTGSAPHTGSGFMRASSIGLAPTPPNIVTKVQLKPRIV